MITSRNNCVLKNNETVSPIILLEESGVVFDKKE